MDKALNNQRERNKSFFFPEKKSTYINPAILGLAAIIVSMILSGDNPVSVALTENLESTYSDIYKYISYAIMIIGVFIAVITAVYFIIARMKTPSPEDVAEYLNRITDEIVSQAAVKYGKSSDNAETLQLVFLIPDKSLQAVDGIYEKNTVSVFFFKDEKISIYEKYFSLVWTEEKEQTWQYSYDDIALAHITGTENGKGLFTLVMSNGSKYIKELSGQIEKLICEAICEFTSLTQNSENVLYKTYENADEEVDFSDKSNELCENEKKSEE